MSREPSSSDRGSSAGDSSSNWSLLQTTADQQAAADRAYWQSKTPEERLAKVERLRIEAGKFLYDYPSRLPRILKIFLRPPY